MGASSPSRKRGIVVPDLAGLGYVQARDRLRELGLTPSPVTQVVQDASCDGQIVAQEPQAGEDVPRGQSVTLVIGRVSGRLFDETVGRSDRPAILTNSFAEPPPGVEPHPDAPLGKGTQLDQVEPSVASRPDPATESELDELGLLRRAAGTPQPDGAARAQRPVQGDAPRDDLSSPRGRRPRRRGPVAAGRRREPVARRRVLALGCAGVATVLLLVALLAGLGTRPAAAPVTPRLPRRDRVATVTLPAATVTLTVAQQSRPDRRRDAPSLTIPAPAPAALARVAAPAPASAPPAPAARRSPAPRRRSPRVPDPHLSPTGPVSGPAPTSNTGGS